MLSIVALTSWLSRLGCIVLGSFYPAYASYRAVLSRDPDEHKQWLAFWVLAAGLALAELLGDACISWLPLYYEAKLAGLAWLTLQRGAASVYDGVVHQYLERVEPEIDAKLAALQLSADAAFAGLKSRAVRHLQRGSRSLLQAGGAALAELAMATATSAALEVAEEEQQEQGEDEAGGDNDGGDDAQQPPQPPPPRQRRPT